MKRFRITNPSSGMEMGTFEGADEQEALEAMARDAGYGSYAEACEVAPPPEGGLLVEEVGAEVAAAPVEVTVEVAGYTVAVEGESVTITRDGVIVGEGRWTGELVEDCGARLGDTEADTERLYEEIDDAISEALAEA